MIDDGFASTHKPPSPQYALIESAVQLLGAVADMVGLEVSISFRCERSAPEAIAEHSFLRGDMRVPGYPAGGADRMVRVHDVVARCLGVAEVSMLSRSPEGAEDTYVPRLGRTQHRGGLEREQEDAPTPETESSNALRNVLAFTAPSGSLGGNGGAR